MTSLDTSSRPGETGPARLGAGPAVPTAHALTAHRPLAHPGVHLTRGLLHDWQERNRAASLPLALRQLVAAGNLGNLRLAIQVAAGGVPDAAPAGTPAGEDVGDVTDETDQPDVGEHASRSAPGMDTAAGRGYRGPVFMDSDIYKTLEAIGWELARTADGAEDNGELTGFTDQAVDLLEQAQEPDGYLDSYIQVSGTPRWEGLAYSHEMYCAGHLIQAAVALARSADGTPIATRLLGVARRVADRLVGTFAGHEIGLDGHPEIETALAELYRETGERAYLDLAKQFVDQRGHGLAGDHHGHGQRYLQDLIPIRDTVTQEGHAVRAMYLDAGVVDVAVETGDQQLLDSSITRWEDMVATKTYLTGGNGSRHSHESFGDRFELPPDRAYNETCAAIASFHWSWRLLLATGDARYADLMERLLYNAFGASISTDGQRFFYVNPLQRRFDHHEGDDPGRRHEWFSCACCPPNIMRLLASLQFYLASTDGNTLFVHQYTGASVQVPLAGGTLKLAMTAELPWSGQVTIRVEEAPAAPAGLALRIPSWSTATQVSVNGEAVSAEPGDRGYLVLRRAWQPGDEVRAEFAVTARWVYPNPVIDGVRGCAAVERGPLVYCFEQADQPEGADLAFLSVPGAPALTERPADLPGIGASVVVDAAAVNRTTDRPGSWPYQAAPAGPGAGEAVTVTAVPYFQWDNRDGRPMRVWLPAVPAAGR
ncbi:MAG TPA: beta-L-arabinofuranosidase domain-containing protein [Streptosporangiaceae bacterium]